MSKLQMLGLGGTNGSGKDTVGQILADKHGFLFISVTDLLRAEAARRNQPIERRVTREISSEWRRELGLGVLVDKAVAEFEIVKDRYKGVVIASLRNPGEADRIHEMGGTVIWVDAEPKMRYDRIQKNKATRGRIEEDDISFEQFLAEEEDEMHTPLGGDAANLNSAGVKALADIYINNDSSDLSVLAANIQTIF